MLRAGGAVSHAEDVGGLDGTDVVADIRGGGSIRQQRGGDADDEAAEPERVRLGGEIRGHVNVRETISRHVIVGEISGDDGDLDEIGIDDRRIDRDSGDAVVKEVEAGVELRTARGVLVFHPVVNRAHEVAGGLGARAVVGAPDLKNEARIGIDGVEVGGGGETERREKRPAAEQPEDEREDFCWLGHQVGFLIVACENLSPDPDSHQYPQ